MSSSYIIFGIDGNDIDDVRNSIEHHLQINFTGHISSDNERYFKTSYAELPQFDLRLNEYRDEEGPLLNQPEFPEYALILRARGFERRQNLKDEILAIPDLNPVILREVVE